MAMSTFFWTKRTGKYVELVFNDISLLPGEDEMTIPGRLAKIHRMEVPGVWRIVRKSLDARHKNSICFRYRVVAEIPDEKAAELLACDGVSVWEGEKGPGPAPRCGDRRRVAIVGTGPAGLFCALRLIEAGANVQLFERGFPVEKRMAHIRLLRSTGRLDPESNVLFGEGGAGTYSDGKLTTRTHRPEMAWVFRTLVECGAPDRILYEQKPHLGTDGLVPVIRMIRRNIHASGAQIHFNTRVDDLVIRDGSVRGVVTAAGDTYEADAVVFATGHSSRDTYEMLQRRGIFMEKKPFALGLRIEHPADLINEIQYGSMARTQTLPAADYRLVYRNRKSGKAVYSFCMCPGGEVINSSSEEEGLCTNGMSYSDRNGRFSNAALVVTVSPEDCAGDAMGGITLQREIEARAYRAGGGTYHAPCQRIPSFCSGKRDISLPAVSYLPGVQSADLGTVLPAWAALEIREAVKSFDRKMRGFISDEGTVIGAETRSSSPVRISRQHDFQSVSHPGLYPVGEGAGYAGGIISSAVDGMRAADMICSSIRDNT